MSEPTEENVDVTDEPTAVEYPPLDDWVNPWEDEADANPQ